MSYGASAVLGSLTAAIPAAVAARVDRVVAGGRGRRWSSSAPDFTDVGHAVALVLGMLVSTRFGQPAAWTPRAVPAAGGRFGFGYLMLANTGLTLVVATGLGVVGALAAEVVVGRRIRRRRSQRPSRTECALTRASRDAARICASPMIAGWLISP